MRGVSHAAVLALLLEAFGCGPGGARPAGQGSGQPPPATKRTAPAVPSAAGPVQFHTATGAVESYDVARRLLVLRAADGESRFLVAPGAWLWVGTHRAGVERLAASLGAQATVAWAESGGVPTTHTVRLSRARTDSDR
jgi:hypothetical protein